jgi:teichuronic acid exporter
MSLKQKTISGLLWSFIDDIAKVGITFISSIILARLLTPREYGLIGMTTIFIAISQSFIDSGFRQALIRKKDCTQADYSTVFYFNLLISAVFYLVLFVFANYIGQFFEEPQLGGILRVLGLGLVINALTLVQQTQLNKNINFKLQTRISIVSSLVSGVISISMAFMGYGVWSLVVKTLSGAFVGSLLLWWWRDWKPSLVFSWDSFREMFAFGSRLLMSGLLNKLYHNIYNLVIGKYFSAADLGFYTQAQTFQKLPSQHLSGVIQRVSYPVLATLQDDIPRLRAAYRKVIQNTMLITFVLMLGMASVAEPLLITLVGEQWRPSIIYLQLLCFVGMLYPLHAINLNMLQVQGRSDLFLRLEVIKEVLAVPVIVIGIFFGIQVMLVCMFVKSLIAYYLNAYWSGEFIGYSMAQQIKDILPSFVLAAVMALIVYFFGCVLDVSDLFKLILQVCLGTVLTVGLAELTRLDNYLYMKAIALDKLKLWRRAHAI